MVPIPDRNSPTPFEYQASRVGDAVVIEVKGEIDMVTAPELEQAIDSASEFTRRVAVDLADVSFIDTTALNALDRCRRRLAEREIALCVVIPPHQSLIRRVFEFTGLVEPLAVVDSLEQAVMGPLAALMEAEMEGSAG